MRLTGKLVLTFIAVVALVLGGYAWVQYSRELGLLDDDLRVQSAFAARILAHDVSVTWRHEDRRAALSLLDDPELTKGHAEAKWVEDITRENIGDLAPGDILQRIQKDNLETWAAVREPQGRLGAVVLRDSLAVEREHAQTILRNVILTAGVLAVASLLATGLLGNLVIGRPTRLLVAKARRIGAGDLGRPLAFRQRDELGEIAREVDAMCERLGEARSALEAETQRRIDAIAQLRHADRLMTVGMLASGVAHELGTPMNVVSGRARMIETGEASGDEVQDCARIIVEQTRRMTTIIRRLLDFARRGEATRKRADLTAPVKRATSILDAIARKANVTLAIDAPASIELDIDEGQIEQVVTNLVVNAIHATPPGGKVDVSVRSVERAAPTGGDLRTWAVVRVSDTGRGMDETTRARCMEPFFTTKEVGEGTGLGLAVVWGIVTDHNGWIDVTSAPDQGSTFSVYLPR